MVSGELPGSGSAGTSRSPLPASSLVVSAGPTPLSASYSLIPATPQLVPRPRLPPPSLPSRSPPAAAPPLRLLSRSRPRPAPPQPLPREPRPSPSSFRPAGPAPAPPPPAAASRREAHGHWLTHFQGSAPSASLPATGAESRPSTPSPGNGGGLLQRKIHAGDLKGRFRWGGGRLGAEWGALACGPEGAAERGRGRGRRPRAGIGLGPCLFLDTHSSGLQDGRRGGVWGGQLRGRQGGSPRVVSRSTKAPASSAFRVVMIRGSQQVLTLGSPGLRPPLGKAVVESA